MPIKCRFLIFSVFMTACRSGAPGVIPNPGIGGPSTTPIDPRSEATSWTISPTGQEHRYTSVTSASLEFTGLSGISRDTVNSTINFSLTISRAAVPATYSARIESISIQGGSRTGGVVNSSSNIPLPFEFDGRLEPDRITLNLPKAQTESPLSCTSETLSAIPAIQRSVILIPLQLRTGMTWTDSTVSTVCSGPLLVSLTSVRTYQVKGQTSVRNRTALILDQQSRTNFTGEGIQDQHRVRVRGDGAGRGQLTVDAETGALLETVSDHTTGITVTSSGRDQRFTQVSRERVTRAN